MKSILALWQEHWRPLTVAVSVGLAFSLLPHFLSLLRGNGGVYIADYDELAVYLVTAAKSFYNHPFYLSDPVVVGDNASAFPWLQFVPFILFAKIVGGGLETASILWRIFAGISMAGAAYLLFHTIFRHKQTALVLALFVLMDLGFNEGRPLLNHMLLFLRTLVGAGDSYFAHQPGVYATWRIITPGLSLWTYLIYLAAFFHAYRVRETKWFVVAGCALGLMFHTYFYFWTAAGASLLFAMAIDYRSWKHYFIVGAVGTAIGLPNLILSSIAKSNAHPDWLPRSDKFLAIGHFEELLIPKLIFLVLVLGGYWVFRYRKAYFPIWVHLLGALFVLNHQILTGLQIENFHWRYVWGPTAFIFILVLATEEYRRWGLAEIKQIKIKKRKWRKYKIPKIHLKFGPKQIVLGALVFLAVSGISLRAMEVLLTKDTQSLEQDYLEFRQLFQDVDYQENATIAGTKNMVYLSSGFLNLRPLNGYPVVLSSSIANVEWDERDALNGFLSGQTVEEFKSSQEAYFGGTYNWGIWARSEEVRAHTIENRSLRYLQILTNPQTYVEKYNIHYIVISSEESVGGIRLLKDWQKIASTDKYELWSDIDPKSSN